MHQGALYPALRSLEKGGLLASEVEPSVSGPPRRYYRITAPGERTLKTMLQHWTTLGQSVQKLVPTDLA